MPKIFCGGGVFQEEKSTSYFEFSPGQYTV